MRKSPALRLSRYRLPIDLTETLFEKLNALPSSVKTDYLLKECFSKYVSHDTAPAEVRRGAAINKWLATERENEATNERLLITPGEYNILPRVTFDRFVSWCQRFIRDIIGDTPPVDALIGSFSGGASTSRSRTCSQPARKFLGKAHVTSAALPVFESITDEMPGWLSGMYPLGSPLVIEEVLGNVLFTVPKKTDIDRVACKEPDLNMFMQKGVGAYFRKSLRRVGINLNDQSINRSLALEGSITGRLATLDLSSASDSVSTGLVSLLLPEAWHALLVSLRSPITIIDGEEHSNQMFSSMGNGFTFELESLLFYTIARAVTYLTGTPGRVSVYGDDIICPAEIFDLLSWALLWFGFSVNTDKSFCDGPFRESCGGHYHNGLDVTPFYIRAPIESMDQVMDVANKLRAWSEFHDDVGILNPETEEIWLWLKGLVPACLWGGDDTSYKYRLVSYDTVVGTGTHRLAETRRSVDAGLGGYYHWLSATWDRDCAIEDGVSTSSFTKSEPSKLHFKRLRTSTVHRLPTHYYYHEVVTLKGVSHLVDVVTAEDAG